MSELEIPEEGRDAPSPELLRDTLQRMIRRVTDQVAADLLAERDMDSHERRPSSAAGVNHERHTPTSKDPI